MKLLIVDDDPSIRRAMQRLSKACGWESWSCDQFADFDSVVRDNAIELLLCDYCMPPITGLDVVQRLRDTGFQLPVIIMTGSPEGVDGRVASRLDIRWFLRKPIKMEDLQRAIAGIGADIARLSRIRAKRRS